MAWISTILFFSSLLVSVLIEKIYDTVKTVFDYISENCCGQKYSKRSDNLSRIYKTFVLGTAFLNFGTRIGNIAHGPFVFWRLKANFLARERKI